MAKLSLPYVQAFKDRHGRMRYYYRKGRVRCPLPGPVGSEAFLTAYAQAQAGTAAPNDYGPRMQVSQRTVGRLITEYYRSLEFGQLAASTQRNYRNILDRFRSSYGTKSVASLEPRHLEAIFHRMAATPGAATNLRRRLSRVFRLAVRLGWRHDNPVTVTEAPRTRSKGFAPWSEAEIARFQGRWPSGSRERLALELLLCTGQRRSDVVGMGAQHVSEGRISVVQAKGGKRLRIRIHPDLQRELAKHTSNLTFLTTQYGRPFSKAGFTQWFVERAVMAGIADRTPHGLRKAAARRLAEARCTAKEIAAVLGHSSLAEVARYTRDADQTHLADGAIARLSETETRTGAVKPV